MSHATVEACKYVWVRVKVSCCIKPLLKIKELKIAITDINYVVYPNILYLYIFNHLADAFIQSDLQMRTTEAINCSIKTTKNRSKTKS